MHTIQAFSDHLLHTLDAMIICIDAFMFDLYSFCFTWSCRKRYLISTVIFFTIQIAMMNLKPET